MDGQIRAEIDALKAEIAELKLSRAQKAIRGLKRNKRLAVGLTSLLIAVPVSLYALSITKTHTFIAGNPTVASEVNANFDQLFVKVNDLAAYHPPIGAIIAWHKNMAGGTPGLPSEWVECNGQTLNDSQSPYHNQVIPNLNGDNTGAFSPGQSDRVAMFLRGGLTSGAGQQDTFQGHKHGLIHDSGATAGPALVSTGSSVTTPGPSGSTFYMGTVQTDGTNGTPRTANETRPVNMSVVWIMKVK